MEHSNLGKVRRAPAVYNISTEKGKGYASVCAFLPQMSQDVMGLIQMMTLGHMRVLSSSWMLGMFY